MDKFDRICHIHRILESRRRAVSLEDLKAELECSDATVYRLLREMKDYLGAPIELDRQQGGYRYTQAAQGTTYELPGLWFSGKELQGLVLLQELLAGLGPGLLEQYLEPLSRRLRSLLAHQHLRLSDVGSRIKLQGLAARTLGGAFQTVAGATLQRRQLLLEYHSRSRDEHTRRVVSPQRLVYYRDNWYLQAHDEAREALRSFSLDRIRHAAVQGRPAVEVSPELLDAHFGRTYGIFGGPPAHTAVLRFSAECARWVADERWHPLQMGQMLPDGRYELRLPYGNPRELLMDILRHGPDVEVVAPASLRQEIQHLLARALAVYASSPS